MKKNDRNPRSFPVDLSLPRWACQNCHQDISVPGFDSGVAPSGMQSSSVNGSESGSVMMDQSFVVLPKQRNHVVKGVPPRPKSGNKHSKIMEESYVVLPPPAASVYKTELGSVGNAMDSMLSDGGYGGGLTSNRTGFSANIKVLERAFDVATSHTQVEQPLCLECMGVLSDNIGKEVEDVERDIEAYESCLKKFDGEEQALSESDFMKEKLKAEEEERKLLAEINEIEKQHAEVNATLKQLEVKSSRFKELEEEYWHDFNSFRFQLTSYQEESDAMLAKTEVAQAHIELLKNTNVLKDAFPIIVEGEFCTINNFRLGRLPNVPVEWDEINAAWGQACLLLHTICQYVRPKFQCRIKILPMGSYSQIMDSSNNTYELFGPVNLYWSTHYDKAMILFVTCLKEFADFANMMDRKNNVSADKCFKLPYLIEDDKVNGCSITHSFNKQETWTKALKGTLCNLKWVLYWFARNKETFRPLSAFPPPSQPESPSSSYIKHGGNSRSSSQYNTKAVEQPCLKNSQ